MQKYVLVNLLKDVPEGTEFLMQNWPLHVTISPRFAVDWENTNLFEKLTNRLKQQPPIETTAGDDEYFGTEGQVHVTLLQMTAQLQSLHDNVLAVLSEAGAVLDELQYAGKNYRAHATVQKTGRLYKGDTITIDSVTIIDMFPEQDIERRKVLQTIRFSK